MSEIKSTKIPTQSLEVKHNSSPSSQSKINDTIKLKSLEVPSNKSDKLQYKESIAKPKLTDYRGFNIPKIKQVYVKLLDDNLQHLIGFIYSNIDKEPYNSQDIRVALAMQMILASNQLIPYQISSMIAKDIEELRKNENFLNQWENPLLKRKALFKELQFLKKHTEIDDTISLNLTDKPQEEKHVNSLKDFDIHSGISTLNVSSSFPLDVENSQNQICAVM